MIRIAWGVTGAGHFIFETFNIMEKIKASHKIACYLSSAGEETVRIYGLGKDLEEICPGGYYQEIICETGQGPASPITGRFQRGKHQLLIISPASSNTVAKLVRGISDSLITNAFAQARKGNIPTLIVPTDQEKEEKTELPYVINREICEKTLGVNHEKCRIINNCSYNAIRQVEGLPKIDLTVCVGCGECLEDCPYRAVSFRKKTRVRVREIDLENVKRLRNFKNVRVLEKPIKIMDEIMNFNL